MIDKERWPSLRNYVSIKQRGEIKLDNGDVVTFPTQESWPEKWETDAHVALLFDDASEKMVKERLLSHLENLEQKYGISFWLAGRDYPIHTTIHAGEPKVAAGEERDGAYTRLEENQELKERLSELNNAILRFDHVLCDGSNIILTSSHIPEKLEEIRALSGKVFSDLNFGSQFRRDILHITLARIRKLPDLSDDELKNMFADYAKDLEILRYEISKTDDPLELVVEKPFVGKDIVHKQRENL